MIFDYIIQLIEEELGRLGIESVGSTCSDFEIAHFNKLRRYYNREKRGERVFGPSDKEINKKLYGRLKFNYFDFEIDNENHNNIINSILKPEYSVPYNPNQQNQHNFSENNQNGTNFNDDLIENDNIDVNFDELNYDYSTYYRSPSVFRRIIDYVRNMFS